MASCQGGVKKHLNQPQHPDAEVLSPGHPLFATLAELLEERLAATRQAVALDDPRTAEAYRLHSKGL